VPVKLAAKSWAKLMRLFAAQNARVTIDALKFIQDADASPITSVVTIGFHFAVFQGDGLRIVLLKINLGVVPAGGESFVKNLEG
jgi:hypothetical protein